MPPKKTVTIWSLNRATDLVNELEQELRGEFSEGLLGRFLGKSIKCNFGQRGPGHNKDGSDDGHRLMHENDDCSEYFVPIAVKCIGNRVESGSADTEGQKLLGKIINGNKPGFRIAEQICRSYRRTIGDDIASR